MQTAEMDEHIERKKERKKICSPQQHLAAVLSVCTFMACECAFGLNMALSKIYLDQFYFEYQMTKNFIIPSIYHEFGVFQQKYRNFTK
jgi:hypothetical protein